MKEIHIIDYMEIISTDLNNDIQSYMRLMDYCKNLMRECHVTLVANGKPFNSPRIERPFLRTDRRLLTNP